MATAVVRGMGGLGQNMHMYQNNCVVYQTTSNNSSMQSNIAGKRQIAPLPSPQEHLRSNNVLGNTTNTMMTSMVHKKKMTYAQAPYAGGGHQSTSVARRNARERNRVKQVNNGFANLRQHIPQDIVDTLQKAGRGASKKLSKVDTLRMALEYIKRLADMLDDGNESTTSTSARSYESSYYVDNSIHHSNSIPTCSEASVSPAPSFTSETSNCNNIYAPTTEQMYLQEHFDNYESTKSSDEELLDVITNWQDQNEFLRQS